MIDDFVHLLYSRHTVGQHSKEKRYAKHIFATTFLSTLSLDQRHHGKGENRKLRGEN